MKRIKFFLERPFGGKPFTNYALNWSDAKEFLVKIYFEESRWDKSLFIDNPFDEDLNMINVDTYGNGALVTIEAEDWVIKAINSRYEIREQYKLVEQDIVTNPS